MLLFFYDQMRSDGAGWQMSGLKQEQSEIIDTQAMVRGRLFADHGSETHLVFDPTSSELVCGQLHLFHTGSIEEQEELLAKIDQITDPGFVYRQVTLYQPMVSAGIWIWTGPTDHLDRVYGPR